MFLTWDLREQGKNDPGFNFTLGHQFWLFLGGAGLDPIFDDL